MSKCEWGSLNCCECCKGRTFILVSPRLSVLEDTLLLGSSVQKHVVASRDTRHPSRQWQLGWRVWPQIQNIPCHHFKWCICWEIKVAEGGSLKRSARQGMHENDMEAERVCKGAHCRTHLPTGDRLLHFTMSSLGSPLRLNHSAWLFVLLRWLNTPLRKTFFLKSSHKFVSLWVTFSLLPHGGVFFHF